MKSALFIAAGVLLTAAGASNLLAADLTGDWRGDQICDCWNGFAQNRAINSGQRLFIQARTTPPSNVYSIEVAGAGFWVFQTVEGTKDPGLLQGVLFNCANPPDLPLDAGEVLQSAQAWAKLGKDKDTMVVNAFQLVSLTDPKETLICECQWNLDRYSTFLDPTVVSLPIPVCSELP